VLSRANSGVAEPFHTLSYANPEELRVRITRLAEAAGLGL
jgi:hypothetical protein